MIVGAILNPGSLRDVRVFGLGMFMANVERDRGASLSPATMARQDRETRLARRVYQVERAKRGKAVVRRRVVVS